MSIVRNIFSEGRFFLFFAVINNIFGYDIKGLKRIEEGGGLIVMIRGRKLYGLLNLKREKHRGEANTDRNCN